MSPETKRGRGQPPIFDVPLTRRFEIRLTETQYQDLTEVAAAEGKNPSSVVRDAVDCYVGDLRERKMFFLSKKKYIPE